MEQVSRQKMTAIIGTLVAIWVSNKTNLPSASGLNILGMVVGAIAIVISHSY